MNITGRLTRDATVKTFDDNRKVVNFSVAVNDSYRNKQGERIEQTAYFNCSYWISSKVANFLVKGTLVELIGRVSARAWLGADGEPKAGLNFHTSQIKLHGGGRKTKNVQITERVENRMVEQDVENDLPF